MSNEELIIGGLKLMVFGMGMVFVFLVVMIFAMNLLEKVLAPFKGMLEPAPKASAKPKAASSNDSQLAAIAATAVEVFRSK
jgi:oxaloacetate decarboxylase gamma subunit